MMPVNRDVADVIWRRRQAEAGKSSTHQRGLDCGCLLALHLHRRTTRNLRNARSHLLLRVKSTQANRWDV